MQTTVEKETSLTGYTSVRDDPLQELVPKRSHRREMFVGAFTLLGIAAVLIALFTMTDAATFRGRYIITGVVPNAGGLRRGDPVQMRGVNVGRVQRFDIESAGVAIRLELEGEYDVPRDSRLVLQSGGLLGGRIAEIVPGFADETLGDGDIIEGVTATGLTEATGELTEGAERALTQINTLLSETTVSAVAGSVLDLRRTLAEMSALVTQQRQDLAAAAVSLRRSAGEVESATSEGQLGRLVARVDSLTSKADEATASLSRAGISLEALMARVERGEGTLGRLTTDDELYTNLNEAALSIRMLAQDIRQNPKKYFEVKVF